MQHAQQSSPSHRALPPPSPASPLYPVPVGDYVVKPREVVKIAGQPLMRTADGRWVLLDQADVAVRETDD